MFMICSMDKAQTAQTSEAPAAPSEERAARHLRLLARAAEIQMEVMEATRTEAVKAPQPGVDYCGRLAVITRSLRLTLLLEEKLAGQRDERRKAVAKREAAQEECHDLRVKLAMLAAAYETSETDEESHRRAKEVCEGLERPEVAELVKASRVPVAVEALCRRWGYPPQVERWLVMADEIMETVGFVPSEDDEHWPEDPPGPRPAGRGRKPRAPDTG